MLKVFLLAVLVIEVLAWPARAGQSLADVARAEEARRKSITARAKVYTNDTLRGTAGGDSLPPPPQPAAADSTTPRPDAASPPSPAARAAAPAPAADPARDEKYWRARITNARTELNRSQTFAEALQSQINALYTEFVNMDDPVRRAGIEQKRVAVIAEQDRVKADIARQTKAVADIEDEARRANVPAGWLR